MRSTVTACLLGLLLALSRPQAVFASSAVDQGDATPGEVAFSVAIFVVLGGAWVAAMAWLIIKRRRDRDE